MATKLVEMGGVELCADALGDVAGGRVLRVVRGQGGTALSRLEAEVVGMKGRGQDAVVGASEQLVAVVMAGSDLEAPHP